MDTKTLDVLQIHKLSKAQYKRELAAGRIDENAMYLTPDEEINVDLTGYVTEDYVDNVVKEFDKRIQNSAANWNQNDPNALDYVKNRTHWEEIKEVLLVDNLTSTTEEEYPKCTFIAGDTYKVIWNGVEYECVCFADGYWKYLAIGGYDIANQYRYRSPFLIQVYDGDGQLMVESYEDSIESWTVSIIHVQKATHQIDPKYIKDMYYEEEYEIDDEALAITFEDKYSDLVIHTFAGDELSRFRDVLDNNSEVTVNVNGTLYTTECRGFDRGYYRLYYNDFVIFECYTGNAPIKISFRYEAIGLESPPVNAKVIFYKTVASEKIHHIHPKYIKDMYYDNDISVLKTRSEITDIINTYGYDVTFRVVVNGVVYDNVPVHADCYVAGGYTWGIGDRFSSSPSGDHWYTTYYGFCVSGYGTVPNSDIFQNGINKVEVYTVEREFKQIDSKFIKDMYHEESIEVFSVENATFDGNQYLPETPFAIVDGHTYIVNWDGVEYVCEAYLFGGAHVIGNTIPFGGVGKNEPFAFAYNQYDNMIFVYNFDESSTTHTFSVTKMIYNTIHPKYIKDMYYEIPEVSISANITGDGNDYFYLDYNLELNEPYTVRVDGKVYTFDSVTKGDYPSASGYYMWYIGAKIVVNGTNISVNTWDYPFTIYSAGYSGPNTATQVRFEDGTTNHTVEFIVGETKIHKIDTKYLPIFEKGTKTVFKAEGIFSENELFDTTYEKLLGKHTVIIDGSSFVVDFIDADNGVSVAETDSYVIATGNGYFYFNVYDNGENPHSVQIIGSGDVIKKEYLSQPDWNQNDKSAVGYIENRPFYTDGDIVHQLDEKYIPDSVARTKDIPVTASEIGLGNVENVKQYSVNNPPVAVQAEAPSDTSVIWVDTDDEYCGELSDAINTALAQAKASGEFDGAKGDPGYTPVKGTDYYTEADKQEMITAVIAALPDASEVSY